jgi:hypothetical protein
MNWRDPGGNHLVGLSCAVTLWTPLVFASIIAVGLDVYYPGLRDFVCYIVSLAVATGIPLAFQATCCASDAPPKHASCTE